MAETSHQSSGSTFLHYLKGLLILQVCAIFITAAMSVADICVGSLYYHNCPAQYLIPNYLIISGITSLLLLISGFFLCGNREKLSILINVFNLIFGLFQLAFFIAGSVWIYSIYAPNYTDLSAANYCYTVPYLYAFWITTLAYIFLALSLTVACCVPLCSCCSENLLEVSV